MLETTIFVGLDVHKKTIAVATVTAQASASVQFFGTIANTPEAIRSMLRKLGKGGQKLHLTYEAGPLGYNLYRLSTGLGHRCDVVAPSLIPRKAGDKIKTDRRDAMMLAQLLRAGQLTEVWVPDEAHEAMRDLVRMRAQATKDQRKTRQQLMSFLLRHGRTYLARTGPKRIAAGWPSKSSRTPRSISCWRNCWPGSSVLRSCALA